MKIIMLDIDGVLNNMPTLGILQDHFKTVHVMDEANVEVLNKICYEIWARSPMRGPDGAYIDSAYPVGVSANAVVHHVTFGIIISSSWRYALSLEHIRNRLIQFGFRYPHRVLDCTPKFLHEPRGDEIQAWCDEPVSGSGRVFHKGNLTPLRAYSGAPGMDGVPTGPKDTRAADERADVLDNRDLLILDDDDVGHLSHKQVRTDPMKGLVYEHVAQAMEILGLAKGTEGGANETFMGPTGPKGARK
jgi:hypothetical protein